MINNNWQKVIIEAATKRIIDCLGQKRFIEGPGSFLDLNGNRNISGSTIVRPWMSSGGWSFMLFAVLWCGITSGAIYLFSIATNIAVNGVKYSSLSEALNANPGMYSLALFPIVSVFLLYVAVAKVINKSTISITHNDLTISYSPLPWPKSDRRYFKADIAQVYVQEHRSNSNKGSRWSYRVVAQLKSGPEEVIENGFNTYSDAKILEQWLELKLNLQDAPVAGEVGT